jgi:hypothetical protein
MIVNGAAQFNEIQEGAKAESRLAGSLGVPTEKTTEGVQSSHDLEEFFLFKPFVD